MAHQIPAYQWLDDDEHGVKQVSVMMKLSVLCAIPTALEGLTRLAALHSAPRNFLPQWQQPGLDLVQEDPV